MEFYLEEVCKIDRQMSIGRKITMDILNRIETRTGKGVGRYRFKTYRKGIGPDQEIILDSAGRVLTQIPYEWLQDANSSVDTRIKLAIRLRDALPRVSLRF